MPGLLQLSGAWPWVVRGVEALSMRGGGGLGAGVVSLPTEGTLEVSGLVC